MKKRTLFTGILSLALVFGMLLFVGCPAEDDGGSSGPTKVTLSAIPGISAPATGGTSVASVGSNAEYTGTATWATSAGTALAAGAAFAANTAYTATIALTANSGYTFDGVSANFFSVGGAVGVSSAGTGTTISVTVTFPTTGAAAVQKGALTIYNISSELIRINVTPAGGVAEDPFTIAAYKQETKQIPIGAGCVVTGTNSSGASPAWNGTISGTATKLEFDAAAGAVGAIVQVKSTLPTTVAGETGISLEFKNDGVADAIIKVKIEEYLTPANYDANYENLAVGSTQTWTTLFTNTQYKITILTVPAAGGAAVTKTGYVKVLMSPGKIKYDGVVFDAQTNGDAAVQVSSNPIP